MPAVLSSPSPTTLVPPSSVYKAHRTISWPSVCLIHCFAVRTGLPSAVSWVFCWDRLGAARPALLCVKASNSIPSAFPTPTCDYTTRTATIWRPSSSWCSAEIQSLCSCLIIPVQDPYRIYYYCYTNHPWKNSKRQQIILSQRKTNKINIPKENHENGNI